MNAKSVNISPVNMAERAKLGLRAGDTVKVSLKIQEKGKTRLQIFEGLVLGVKHGKEPGATFTVRRVASGVGVEKIFPLYSPLIDKITVVKSSQVRRAKLYHIRKKAAKEIRREMRNIRTIAPVDDESSETEDVSTEETSAEAPVTVTAEAEA